MKAGLVKGEVGFAYGIELVRGGECPQCGEVGPLFMGVAANAFGLWALVACGGCVVGWLALMLEGPAGDGA